MRTHHVPNDAADPGDPVQGMTEVTPLHLEDLDVDAMSRLDSEADVDGAALESAIDQDVTVVDAPEVRMQPDDDLATGEGRSWTEALEISAAENGPTPEQPIEIDDEERDAAPAASSAADLPIADRGSAGPAGR